MKRVLPALLVVLALVLLVLEATRPPEFDQTVTLRPEGTQPFDARIAFEQLPALVEAPVTRTARPAFELLSDTARTAGRTLLFATPEFHPDETEAPRLLAFVRRGGTLFVAAGRFSSSLADSLGAVREDGTREPLEVRSELPRRAALPRRSLPAEGASRDATLFPLAPGLARPDGYTLPVPHYAGAISGADPARTTVLIEDAAGRPVFVRVAEGQGQVLVLGTPMPLTNAALVLDGDGPALLAVLAAYLPPREVLWDAPEQALQSPLRVALAEPALRWALALAALGALLAVLFRGRRWQRPIPVIASPPNAQRAFARTVGRLYFTHGDHARLARRMARLFQDHLRTRLLLPEADLSDETARRAAARAGVPPEEARALFADLRALLADPRPQGPALVALDRRLIDFFRHATGLAPAEPGAPLPRPEPVASALHPATPADV
ncbi:MAG: DUF4350 domain-containing protein [Rubricoccaceae bacterium]